jgi:CheY-like chemotaxis protein/HPt (histidine-containing phosphotransfer) domain-containing protein
VVDDNPLARETLAALCRAAGWQVETAQDGAHALERVVASGAMGLAYDAVFVDWLMPGLDGWQTCMRIRQLPLPQHTPLVIMVTAHGREMMDRRPAREQALLDGFLVKPVTTGMLRLSLERGLRGDDQPATAPVVSAQPLAGLRLLLAEDNPVNQQIATEMLSRRGAEIDVVDNGQAAVDRLAGGQRYDAVLMDIQMPVMDGLAATRELRRIGATLPIIAMTANAMDSDREACLLAGMNDHVAKPFAIEKVVATVLKHLAAARTAAAGDPREPTSATPLPVFDRAGALERLGGDEQLLRTVLPVFRTNLNSAEVELAAWRTAAPDDVARLMHSIKGMAGSLGAMALADAATRAEVGLRTADEPGADGLVAEVASAIEAVFEALGGRIT